MTERFFVLRANGIRLNGRTKPVYTKDEANKILAGLINTNNMEVFELTPVTTRDVTTTVTKRRIV